MKIGIFQSALRVLGLTLGTCAALALSAGVAQAKGGGGGGGGGAPTCTINTPQNDPVSVTTGGSELFRGTVSGGTVGDGYDVTWTFEGGAPADATEQVPTDGGQTQTGN